MPNYRTKRISNFSISQRTSSFSILTRRCCAQCSIMNRPLNGPRQTATRGAAKSADCWALDYDVSWSDHRPVGWRRRVGHILAGWFRLVGCRLDNRRRTFGRPGDVYRLTAGCHGNDMFTLGIRRQLAFVCCEIDLTGINNRLRQKNSK